VDTGGTGGASTTFSSGRISGFGSVIVNGVRFDDSSATVRDDDDSPHLRDDLKLGMVVDIQSGDITPDSDGASVGIASQIVFVSEIKGPVGTVNPTAGTLTVMGQSVHADANTVFANVAGGLSSLQAGDPVEVFGFLDSVSNRFLASRIEKKTDLATYKLRGRVANLDTLNKTFRLSTATISYASIDSAQVPVLNNGQLVHVKLQTTVVNGVWTATKLSASARHVPDRARTEIEGFVTDFVSAASFKVNGVAVDAGGTRGAGVVFRDGTAAQLANGVRVEVKGTMSGDTLVAARVSFDDSGHGGGGHGDLEIELHGAMSSVMSGSGTFLLRGLTVHYDGSTVLERGTTASIRNGARVKVKATLISGSSDVQATKIEFRAD